MDRPKLSRISHAALTSLLIVSPCSADWDVTHLGEGFASDIAIDSKGSPHLAISTSNGLEYRTFIGGSFVTQETIASSNSFALDANDVAHFVAKTGAGFTPELLYRDESGSQRKIAIANHRVGTLKLIGFDGQDRPHVAYNHPDDQTLIHSAWDGVSWNPRVVASGPNFRFGNSGFTAAIDGDDQAHFIWDDDSDQLQYARPIGSGWNTEPIFEGQDAFAYNFEIDPNGAVHLAYDVFTGSTFTGGLFYGTTENGLPRNERVPVEKNFGASRASLTLNDEYRPSIFNYDSAFAGPVDLVHYELTDDGWESTVIDTHPSPQFSGPDQIKAAYGAGRQHVLFSTGDRDIFYAVQEIPEPATGLLLIAISVIVCQAEHRRVHVALSKQQVGGLLSK